ncbi:MAG: Lrp/AsnC ligand binding domain-containing protein [Candidatus Pacearchaeota archaeon]|jgi:DNA-binding Lrp family transcriptional regulator
MESQKENNNEMESSKEKYASFLLIKTNLNVLHVLQSLNRNSLVKWAEAVYGPYQIVVYMESCIEQNLINFIENLRSQKGIAELDARKVKNIPFDENLKFNFSSKKRNAVLLINVNYKEERERVVTYNLRKIGGVFWARAMWGPSDIIALVEANDNESMRNLICDEIKTLNGVQNNTTLYCYSI